MHFGGSTVRCYIDLPTLYVHVYDSTYVIYTLIVLVWEVARMASAAPMYFTDYNGYIDGGIQANNPCEQGLNEISEYYERNHMTLPHFPIMVSIGTGIFPSQELKDNKMFLATAFDGFSAIKNLFNSLLAAVRKYNNPYSRTSDWLYN